MVRRGAYFVDALDSAQVLHYRRFEVGSLISEQTTGGSEEQEKYRPQFAQTGQAKRSYAEFRGEILHRDDVWIRAWYFRQRSLPTENIDRQYVSAIIRGDWI